MVEVLGGWAAVGLVYLLGCWGLTTLFYQPLGSWALPPAVVGATLIVVPYVAGGLYCRLLWRRAGRIRGFPLIVGLVPAVGEKVLGLWIIRSVWASGAEGSPGQSFWDFLATDVPDIAWFTPIYWAVGLVVSPLLVQLLASPPSWPFRVRQPCPSEGHHGE
jgi:hypothetical protein